MGGDGSGGNSFDATIVIVSAMQKEERKNDKQKGTNIDKSNKIQLQAFKKQERRVLIPFQYKEALLVV